MVCPTVDPRGELGLIDVEAKGKRSVVLAEEMSTRYTCNPLCGDLDSG